jgi:hypothetical protein
LALRFLKSRFIEAFVPRACKLRQHNVLEFWYQ